MRVHFVSCCVGLACCLPMPGIYRTYGQDALPGDVLYFVTDLGDLPGGYECCYPLDINELGQVTGRSCVDPSFEAFLWDPVDGMIGLGDLPGGAYQSEGEGVNNGGHVGGTSRGEIAYEAFLWTPETGMVGLGDLPGGTYYSEGHGINDHDQVVGFSRSDAGQEAFLWDPNDGMVGLGFLPGGGVSVANDINNATQVVGSSCSAERLEAFIWDPVNGMRGLGTMPGGHYGLDAYAINELGQVAGTASNSEAFLWDPVDGMIGLGVLPGRLPVAYGRGVNNLEQVVGWNLDLYTGANDAFIWDRAHGMRDLDDLLAAGDAEYAPLRYATGINDAGQVIGKSLGAGGGILLDPFVVGDMNCDDVVDEDDIGALLLILLDPEEYAQTYPDCPGEWAGDVNQDAVLDLHDLHALRDFLGSAPSAQPGHYLPPEHILPMP
ncbi:MAG TPA: hypothetical protein VM487_05440 [Phycisphaerae bacterium]|nr:hypothetical protein [Phycisphaerae bacterium]